MMARNSEKRMREKMRILRWTRRAAPASAIAMAALLAAAIGACAQEPVQVASPDGRNVVTVRTAEGGLFYTVERDGRKIILPSRLGFEFRDAPPLRDGLELAGTERTTVDESWEQPWGEVARVRDHHNELRVSVDEMKEPRRRFDLVLRVLLLLLELLFARVAILSPCRATGCPCRAEAESGPLALRPSLSAGLPSPRA